MVIPTSSPPSAQPEAALDGAASLLAESGVASAALERAREAGGIVLELTGDAPLSVATLLHAARRWHPDAAELTPAQAMRAGTAGRRIGVAVDAVSPPHRLSRGEAKKRGHTALFEQLDVHAESVRLRLESAAELGKGPRPRALPGRPRRYGPDEELRLLFDAAIEVMRRNEYGEVTVAEILTEAGVSTRSFSTSRSPTCSRISADTVRGDDPSRDHPRRISAATSTLSRTLSVPKVSSRWNERAMPSRARL